MTHHKHKRHSHYSFRGFMNDVSRPFITVERDMTGAVKTIANSKLGLGLGIATPIIIVGVGAIAFYVLSRKWKKNI